MTTLARALQGIGAGAWITRFAPSPNGYLHLGHMASALYTWSIARRVGAKVILRIEDHDLSRYRPEYETAIYEDLARLGFSWDEAYKQSDFPERYEGVFSSLEAMGRTYFCSCSRREVAGEGRVAADGTLVYPGTCRDKALQRNPQTCARLRVDPRPMKYMDLTGGWEVQMSDDYGDFVLKDRTGQWTYLFSSTVDDAHDGVNLIVRGEDLRSSVGRQRYLSSHWDGNPTEPTYYYHHPLICNAHGQKLAKSNMDQRALTPGASKSAQSELWQRVLAGLGIPCHEVIDSHERAGEILLNQPLKPSGRLQP